MLQALQKIVRPIMKVQVKIKSKVFWNPSQLTTGFENFGGNSVGCLNIIEDKTLDSGLNKHEGHSQLRRGSQVRCNNGISTKMQISSWRKRENRVQTLDAAFTLLIKREPECLCALHQMRACELYVPLGRDPEKPVSFASNNRARSMSNARLVFLL